MPIKKDYPATIKAIKNCIGKTVSGIARVQYYFNNEEDDDGFGDLEIRFDNDLFLTISGVGDAESISAFNHEKEVYKKFNITEDDICSWEKIDLEKNQDWKNLIGQKLLYAEVEWNIYDDLDDNLNTLVACILHFENDFITFYETGADANKFFINQPLEEGKSNIRIEKIE